MNQHWIKRGIRLIGFMLMGIILVGCSSYQTSKSYRYYLTPAKDNETLKQVQVAPALMAQLRSEGAQVTQVGETIRIILYSDQLFTGRSANFQSQALWRFPSRTGCCSAIIPAYKSGILDTLASLMMVLQTTSAQVSGNTNASVSERVNQALSLAQAQAVTNYLWEKGVDTRLLYAVGYGSSKPLSADPADAVNRRIEIQFQYVRYGLGSQF